MTVTCTRPLQPSLLPKRCRPLPIPTAHPAPRRPVLLRRLNPSVLALPSTFVEALSLCSQASRFPSRFPSMFAAVPPSLHRLPCPTYLPRTYIPTSTHPSFSPSPLSAYLPIQTSLLHHPAARRFRLNRNRRYGEPRLLDQPEPKPLLVYWSVALRFIPFLCSIAAPALLPIEYTLPPSPSSRLVAHSNLNLSYSRLRRYLPTGKSLINFLLTLTSETLAPFSIPHQFGACCLCRDSPSQRIG